MSNAAHTACPWKEPGTYGATRFEIIGAGGKSIAIVNRLEDAPPELTAQMRTAITKARGA